MTSILRGTALLTLALAMVALPAQGAARTAPDFTLQLFTGKTLSLNELKGSAVILLFWAPGESRAIDTPPGGSVPTNIGRTRGSPLLGRDRQRRDPGARRVRPQLRGGIAGGRARGHGPLIAVPRR